MKKFLLSFLFLFFCACSFKPDLVEEPTAHSLHINEAKVKTDSYKSKKSLQILSIQSPFYLKTNKIYYRQGSVFGKYAKHVFSDSPVNFVEAKLKRYFENSKLFSAVMLSNTNANTDYLLELDLQSFEKLYKEEGKVYVESRVNFSLIEAKSNKILEQRVVIFEHRIGPPDNIEQTIITFNNVLNKMAAYIATHLEERIKKLE